MTPGEGAAKFEHIFPPFGVGDPSIYIYALHSVTFGGNPTRRERSDVSFGQVIVLARVMVVSKNHQVGSGGRHR